MDFIYGIILIHFLIIVYQLISCFLEYKEYNTAYFGAYSLDTKQQLLVAILNYSFYMLFLSAILCSVGIYNKIIISLLISLLDAYRPDNYIYTIGKIQRLLRLNKLIFGIPFYYLLLQIDNIYAFIIYYYIILSICVS